MPGGDLGVLKSTRVETGCDEGVPEDMRAWRLLPASRSMSCPTGSMLPWTSAHSGTLSRPREQLPDRIGRSTRS
jgi:hypothetical protein